MNRNPILCQSFVRHGKEFFLEFPQVKHEWSIDQDEDHCILDIPEEYESGFPITVEVEPSQIMVYAQGAHTEFPFCDENPDDLVKDVLGLVRDLLSPAMRIRERLAGGKPYKWAFEVLHEGEWIPEEWVGLLFWNYFGKRSEKIYQNKILSERESPIG